MKVIEQLDAISDERFHEIYEALSKDGFGPLDAEVAMSLKFRPQAIRKLSLDKRSKRARSILMHTRQADLCFELFGTDLMTRRKQLVIDFLEGSGVEHEDGMRKSADDTVPDVAKLGPTIADRMTGLNLVGAQILALLVLYAVREGRSNYLDVALVYDIFGFIGILAMARYFVSREERA